MESVSKKKNSRMVHVTHFPSNLIENANGLIIGGVKTHFVKFGGIRAK